MGQWLWDAFANIIGGIAWLTIAVVRCARWLLLPLAIWAVWLWWHAPDNGEQKVWDAVLEDGKWKSYGEKATAYEKEMENRIKNAKKPVEPTPAPSGRKPLELPQDGKITMQLDMGFSLMDRQVYLRENPNSMKADFLVLCVPDNLAKLPMSPENQHLWRFYNKLIEDLRNDVASSSGWSYRATRQRRWVVVFADPVEKNLYPNPTFEAASSPPVGENACFMQDGTNGGRSFSRNYFKLSGVP